MLTSVKAISAYSGVSDLVLDLNDLSADPIQIRDVQGLGPVKANVNTSPYGNIDGESYSGSSVGKRNIVLTLGLNPNWSTQTVSSLRQMLYAYFMPKLATRLQFTTDEYPIVEISGWVESCEPNIFSKDPEMQVSIICPLPDFIATASTSFADTVDADASTPATINYTGTVPTGFVLEVTSSVARASYTGILTIKNATAPSQILALTGNIVVDASYKFQLTTARGAKSIRRVYIPTGSLENLMGLITPNSDWPMLLPGPNAFSVYAALAGQNWSMTYFKRYGGL